MTPLNKPWAREIESVLKALDTTPDGLTPTEANKRQKEFGPNRLRQAEQQSLWSILVAQFKSLIVGLLVAAAILSFALGEWVDGGAIIAVVLVTTAIGFVTELRAVRSMESLQQLVDVKTRVRRDGQERQLDAKSLVPGDIVVAEGGDVITADLRLIETSRLQANEASLTGESVPVEKSLEPVAENTPLADRSDMLFKGTHITRGAAAGVVVATGMDTELGRISSLAQKADAEFTPLEKRLDKLGRRLVWLTLGILVIVAGIGILNGKDPLLMLETGVALAIAAIPEGLPIVATIALARGMVRMARRNALINKLAAVETLGSTNIICTDKTGTLTENQTTVTTLYIPGRTVEVTGQGLAQEGDFIQEDRKIDPVEAENLELALKVGVLCNNASINEQNESIGDPLDAALLVAGIKADIHREDLLAQMPETREVAFDPQAKMMATFHRLNGHRAGGRYRVAVKGAPEAVLDRCSQIASSEDQAELGDADRQTWLKRSQGMAHDGLRILALATKTTDEGDADPYQQLNFLGLVGFLDPAREDVRPSIQACHQAGIQVVMVTGDHPETARKVAAAVGLVNGKDPMVMTGQEFVALDDQEKNQVLEADILARVSPEQKLELINAYQRSGAIVAMTGDGVNDAPALKKADIGIAMGKRGTQVAQEAADMVLQDDAFATIVEAIGQGRVIFSNIRNFVLYLLSCNISEVLVVFLATLINAPLPIRPLQILYLNLVTDVFPALALGVGEGSEGIMDKAPRNAREPILNRRHWASISFYGLLITVGVIAALILALEWLAKNQQEAVTISFLTLAFAQLWNVFNMRDRDSSIWANEITRNPYVWIALALCTALIVAATYLPVLSDVLGTVPPGLNGWLLVLGLSLIPLIVGQIVKSINFTRSFVA